MKTMPTLNMNQINYKWIAIGILIGYLSPYVLALMKSYFSPSQETNPQESIYAN